MKRGLAALALCLLLVLSGCSALLGPSGSADDVPGVEDGSLADSDALVDAHVEALLASGFTHELRLNFSQVVRGEVTNVTRIQRTRVTAQGDSYQFELETQGPRDSQFEVWANETTAFRRFESGGSGPRYTSGPAADARNLTGVNLLRSHLTAPYEVVETAEADGRTLVTLESTGKPTASGPIPENASDDATYDARLVVDTDGRIHEFEVDAEYTLDGQPSSYDVTFELTGVENPTIERPSWVDSAQNSG